MKAVIQTQYGSPDVLRLADVEKPTPKDNQVLIKIYAASVNAADWHLMRADPFLIRLAMGLFKPKNPTLGADIAGRVEAVGKNVTLFRTGDEVFGDISGCGMGGFAEYVAVPETVLALKPSRITFEQAAAAPMASVTSLQGLRDYGKIRSGQKVLINGAGGGLGTFAIQLAKSFGTEVTAVCSTPKMDMVRSLGADHIIDYKHEDVTRKSTSYDLIYDAGAYRSIFEYRRILRPGGTYVMAGGSTANLFQSMILSPLASRGGLHFVNVIAKPNVKDLNIIGELLEKGVIVPVIDRCYSLNETADAIRDLEAGRVKGKAVITIADA